MKKNLTAFMSKPKLIIPLFAIIVAILGGILYTHIGRAPAVPSSINTLASEQIIASGSNVSLSFSQTGRIESVSVKEGDTVHKGQVIARLSAPQAQGAVSQAKGALDLAQAQYASLNIQYNTAKTQQDQIVANAYKTLLSSGLEGSSNIQDPNIPVITGTYTCNQEGSYVLKPYASADSDSRFSINYSGIETGVTGVKYDNAVPLGNCGLQIKFMHLVNFNPNVVWTIAIPNTKGSSYLANKNAYDLAVTNREKTLADLASTIGQNSGSSVAKAQVDAAYGAYQAAVGAYQNNLIIAPVDGVVTFVDKDLKVGQSVVANKPVISINAK
jgi:multidrug efflux pump subunit AcrA (membrane-fusion protein)